LRDEVKVLIERDAKEVHVKPRDVDDCEERIVGTSAAAIGSRAAHDQTDGEEDLETNILEVCIVDGLDSCHTTDVVKGF
jgi:hypothetical protein